MSFVEEYFFNYLNFYSRYLATMSTLTDIAEKYCIGRSTACEIVRKVCVDIWDIMKEECIPLPSTEKWIQIAKDFETRGHFPNCIGAIDGKHIRVTKPYNSGSLFHNYKNHFSIVLLALADSDYRFIYVNIGAYGKDSDCNIFKNSSLWTGLNQKTLGIPEPVQFPGATSPLPYVIVGDEAFGLTNFLLTPYSGHNLTPKKRIFNYRLTLARRYVECTFGLLSNKWRIFHRALNTSVDFSDDIIKACCVLHNFVRDRDGFRLEDTLNLVGFEDIDIEMDNVGSRANVQEIRNEFATYFTSNVGSVPWQNRAIM